MQNYSQRDGATIMCTTADARGRTAAPPVSEREDRAGRSVQQARGEKRRARAPVGAWVTADPPTHAKTRTEQHEIAHSQY